MTEELIPRMVECGVEKAAGCSVTQAHHVDFRQLLRTYDKGCKRKLTQSK
jgi:hypothetical protein